MIILTSLCGGDGNALKHDGIQREDMNASPAALINTPPSAENLKLKAGMPSQERPLIYSSASVCALHHRCCRKYLCGANNPSFFPSLPIIPSFFFPLFIFHLGLGAVVHSSPPSLVLLCSPCPLWLARSPPPPPVPLCTRLQPVMWQRSEDVCGCWYQLTEAAVNAS